MPRNIARSVGGALVTGLLALAAMVPTAWFALYLAFADRWWWLFVANSLAPVLFMPLPLALILAWFSRKRRMFLALLVPSGVAAFLWLGTFLPARALGPAVPDRASTISVMTFNVEAGNRDLDDLEAAILGSGAQLVALQELNEGIGVALAQRLNATHPYADLAPCPPCGDWGSLGVLSAFPLEPVAADLGGPSERNPQLTLMHHPRGDVLVVNVHNLSTPRFPQIWPEEITRAIGSREAVAEALAELARNTSTPLLAVGDFNTTERSGAYRIITRELEDSWRALGFGFGSTFHGGAPEDSPARLSLPNWLLRIDYVFHSRDLTTLSVKVAPWRHASDHRPVTAVVAFTD